MRVEMVFHSYIEIFNRLISIRIDLTDWEFRVKKTRASRLLYAGPIHLGYTNQNIINENIKEMLATIEQDLEYHQVKEKPESTTAITSGQNILH